MKGFGCALSATIALAATAMSSTTPLAKRALTPVTVRGNAFFVGNERFYMRGVDYQPGGSSNVADPLADPKICKRDIEKFKKLGLNTIRVYSIDNSVNHDECMNALADAGIYLVLDVNTPLYSINRADPRPSYNDVYLQNVFATVDMFAKYDNTLAFFSGNEVINDVTTTKCAPYVKAVTRDIRQYLAARKHRQIPVGYSAADVAENRKEMADYMNCGSNDERSDFYAFNDYSWCNPSSFTTSGWDKKVQNFTDYSIPIFLSEFGCIKTKRTFAEVAALYSTSMSPVFSGGLVYEYSEEGSGYGLVKIENGAVEELNDFKALQTALTNQKNPTGDAGYKRNGSPSRCPSASVNWEVTSDSLPAIPEPAKKYFTEGAGRGVGLSGTGSQNAGTPSTSTAQPGSNTVPSGTATGTAAGKKGAAASLHATTPSTASVVCALVLFASALFGSALL